MLPEVLFKPHLLLFSLSLLFVGCGLSKSSAGRLQYVSKSNCTPKGSNTSAVATPKIKDQRSIPLEVSKETQGHNYPTSFVAAPIHNKETPAIKNIISLKSAVHKKTGGHRKHSSNSERSNSEKLKSAKSLFLAESIIYSVLSVLSIPFALLILTWGGSILGFVITGLGITAAILSIALFIRVKKLLKAYNEYEAHQFDYDGADAAAKPEMKGNPKALYVLSRVGLVPIILVFTLVIFTLVFL